MTSTMLVHVITIDSMNSFPGVNQGSARST
jgi:hypothetical protein